MSVSSKKKWGEEGGSTYTIETEVASNDGNTRGDFTFMNMDIPGLTHIKDNSE